MKVTVPSLAKINLDLRVLYRRPDEYHELRTVFQTITLADRLSIDFDPGRRTEISLDSSVEIADNLVLRAARLVTDQLKIRARIRFSLYKRIPMGGGLGGGSSNAAAVLLALPALASKHVPRDVLAGWAESLGSDVPFFLYGGTALGLGRGTEIYPLPEQPARAALIVHQGVHVSTAEAYKVLQRTVSNALTSPLQSPMLREFQGVAWAAAGDNLDKIPLKNDFEAAVFRQHPELAKVARKLKALGARPALMTGSGSAVFGVFSDPSEALAAASHFRTGTAWPVRFVSRKRYGALWQRALGQAAGASCFAGH